MEVAQLNLDTSSDRRDRRFPLQKAFDGQKFAYAKIFDITGAEVRTLRESLGLSSRQLANLLGVHLGTIYRWEAFEGSTLRLESLQFSLLLQLQRKAAQMAPADLGKQLIERLLIGGTLVGLAFLLSDLVADNPKRRSE